jgi:hypothetical protein
MSPSTTLPDRNSPVAELAAAIVRQLRRSLPDGPVVQDLDIHAADGQTAGPVLVPGTASVPAGGAVAAAVNDDASCGMVVKHAHAEARRLGVPLRVVHVWTGTDAAASGARLLRHDRMSDADHLLAAVLYENLPEAEADLAEREILHDPEPVRALTVLSASLSLLVVAAAAVAPAQGQHLGGIAGGLVGRTVCPLVVVPAIEASAIW